MKDKIIILLLILCLILLYVCFSKWKVSKSSMDEISNEKSNTTDHYTSDSLKLIDINKIPNFLTRLNLFSILETNTEIISEVKAKKMIQDCVYSMIDSNDPSYNDTNKIERSVHFKLGLILHVMDSIRQAKSDMNFDSFGLRIYFAKYSNNSDYQNRYTTVLKLTYNNYNIPGDSATFNLGGLCPPKCNPMTYYTKDPLFH